LYEYIHHDTIHQLSLRRALPSVEIFSISTQISSGFCRIEYTYLALLTEQMTESMDNTRIYNQLICNTSICIRGSRFWDFFGFSISYSLQLMGKTILRLKYKRCFSLFSCLPMPK
jgi:hypothetical protein